MATQLSDIEGFLNQAGIKHSLQGDVIMLGFSTNKYLNIDGDNNILLIVELLEKGEYFKIYAPNAFKIPDKDPDVFLKECAKIQWQTKLIQFRVFRDRWRDTSNY